MKVCFFAHYSITNSDGATLSMYNIIDEMLRRGIEVVVVLANTRSLEGRIAEGKDANGFEQKNSDDASEVLCEKYL